MNQEESVYELNRIQRYIMQMRPLLKKNALFSDGTADYRQPVEPDAGDEVTVRFRTARDNVDIVWLCTGDKKYKMKNKVNILPDYSKKIKKLLDLNNPKKELIDTLVDKIVIDKDRNITIFFKYDIVSEVTFKYENRNLARNPYGRKGKKF